MAAANCDNSISANSVKQKRMEGRHSLISLEVLILNDLANCAALSEVFKAQRREKETARLARVAQERETYCKEQNQKAEEAVSKVVQVICDGEVLTNSKVTFYRGQDDSKIYTIVNYLMRQYQVDAPLRPVRALGNPLSRSECVHRDTK